MYKGMFDTMIRNPTEILGLKVCVKNCNPWRIGVISHVAGKHIYYKYLTYHNRHFIFMNGRFNRETCRYVYVDFDEYCEIKFYC